jgi:D-inositol-3-phosphate glycosyltransferase
MPSARGIAVHRGSAAEIPAAEETLDRAFECLPGQEGVSLGLLTGCQDRHYAFGLAMALASCGVHVDVVGSDEIDSPELHATPNLRFFNFRGAQKAKVGLAKKLSKVFVYYVRLIRYLSNSEPKAIHILWNYKFELLDRTVLMLVYKALGKKVALTAHNVNQARRDAKDSWINRTTLKMQYRLCDHIFVHTQKMKEELCQDFQVAEARVTVLHYPVNNAFLETKLTPLEAKQRLGLGNGEKVLLFFGRIRPYKGIEHLLDSFGLLPTDSMSRYRLIIAGEPKKGSEDYLHEIERSVTNSRYSEQVILKAEFIRDEDMEVYFKAADVLVLPYKEIFQSGVLFLGYSFGLPAIATDVGSFREDIIPGLTGFLCQPGDAADMAQTIEAYFASDLYKNLRVRRQQLKDYVNTTHSWGAVADLTCNAYAQMLGRLTPS